MLLINFKTYEEAEGEKAVEIAKIAAAISKESSKRVAVVPNFVDLKEVSEIIETFAPHVDPLEPGSHTGHTIPAIVDFLKGVVLNHSEYPMLIKDIEAAVQMAKEEGLETVICANNVAVARAVATFEPTYVAVEPPGLIGGDVSVSTAKPDIIKEAVKVVKPKSKLLVGAGVKTKKDVEKAVELGADGVFVASGVVKAKDVRLTIKELVDGLGR